MLNPTALSESTLWTRGPKPMDLIHAAINLFHRFSNRKINPKLENSRRRVILQKHPKLF
jgi:hypothetical protein